MPFHLNRAVRRDDSFHGLFEDAEYADVHAYFAVHPELPPTPLTPLPSIARTLGIGAIDAKDESHRFGIEAFKILGVRYAVHRLGADAWQRGLVCATAGNHGRAVARVARQKAMPCTVFVPVARTTEALEQQTRDARVSAMRADGATVVEVQGTYEEAVRRAAAHGLQTGAAVVSDTSWDGYEEIPRWIMAGYTQLFEEAASQWDSPPGIVVVQGGVGGLVCAAVSWFAWRFGPRRPFIVAAEPENAACLLASGVAGRPVTIDSSLDTIMAGLRCAEPSPAAWSTIAAGVDAFVTVDDDRLRETMALLSGEDAGALGIGPSGACGLAGLREIAERDVLSPLRRAAGLSASTRALVVLTEGRGPVVR